MGAARPASAAGGPAVVDLDLTRLAERERYKVLAGLVVPRPIAWITTRSASGQVNLAPFSFFQVMSTDAPTIGVGIQAHDDGRVKDTLRAVRETGEFVVNLARVEHMQAVDDSSAEYPARVSEAEALGLELADWHGSVPRLAGVPAALGCHLVEELQLSERDAWVIGRVRHVAADPDVLGPGLHVDYARYHPLGRLVGRLYVDTGATPPLVASRTSPHAHPRPQEG